MFEQSLVPSPAGRRPVLMAASAGLQALAVAVLLLIPLLHSGLLPDLMPHAPLTAPLALSPAPLPGPVAPAPEKPMAIGGDVEAARCLACPPPEYPAFARQAGMQGTVELHAVISTEGTVTRVERLSGNPVLAAAALRAVRNWRYRPLSLDGRAVAVDTLITVRFALAH